MFKLLGNSCGILIMWDDHIEKIFSVSIKNSFPNDLNNYSWWLIAIYEPNGKRNRDGFWVELEELKSICLPNWLVGGDFNICC